MAGSRNSRGARYRHGHDRPNVACSSDSSSACWIMFGTEWLGTTTGFGWPTPTESPPADSPPVGPDRPPVPLEPPPTPEPGPVSPDPGQPDSPVRVPGSVVAREEPG